MKKKSIRINSLSLITSDNKVLVLSGVDKKTNEVFYRLLGGGVEFGEESLIALKREVKEELGATSDKEKFLEIVENIFEYNGDKMHEITFLFKSELLEDKYNNVDKIKILDKPDDFAYWIPRNEILKDDTVIYPKEIKKYI